MPTPPDRLIPPKLATVARSVGVSVSTASRALQNNPQIAIATRQRVQAAAHSLGYQTNPYISTLMAHVRRTRPLPYRATFAWIDRLPANTWRENPVQNQFFNGASERAKALGFSLERVRCAEPRLRRARLGEIMLARGINGVLCSADTPEPGLATLPFDVNSFAVVTVGCRFSKPDLNYSTNDQFLTARTAHRRLRELGYRRIGFVTTRGLEELVDYRCSAGFLSACPSLGEPPQVPLFFAADDNNAFAAWLHQHRPDAVLTTFMTDLIPKIEAAGFRVPTDIAFAALDWDESLPHIAGMRQNHRRVGAAAVDMLVAQINRNEFGAPANAQGMLIEGKWADGETAPPAQYLQTKRLISLPAA